MNDPMRMFSSFLLSISLLATSTVQDRSGLNSSGVDKIVSAFKDKKLADKDLIPAGYIKVKEARGDLNQDGIDDVVLIVQQNAAQDSDQSDLPQIILLFLGDKSGAFTFWKIGPHHFLNSNPNFISEGGVGELKIQNGVLIIQSETSLSMGGWGAGGCTQKWRSEKSGFRLIGLTLVDMMRNCGCGDSRDTNYLTGDQILTSDRGPGGERAKKKITKTKRTPEVILWDDFDYDKFCTM